MGARKGGLLYIFGPLLGGVFLITSVIMTGMIHNERLELRDVQAAARSTQLQLDSCDQKMGTCDKALRALRDKRESVSASTTDARHAHHKYYLHYEYYGSQKISNGLDQAAHEEGGRWTDGRTKFDLPEDVCDFDRVDGPSWFRERGCSGQTCSGKMPDKPTVFTGLMDDWLGMKMNWSYEVLVQQFGNVRIELLDEWEQAGGVLAYSVAGKSGGKAVSVRDVARKFKSGFLGEHEDFYCGAVDQHGNDRNGHSPQGRVSVDCSMSLCCLMKKKGLVKVPEQLQGDSFPTGESFSWSPAGGGFSMHAHAAAWLGLVHGEKAWFVESPDRIGPSLPYYHLVLPQILNARSFAQAVMKLPPERRPYFCVQRRGELLFLPDAWWHATLNRGDFSLAFGTKPTWFNLAFRDAGKFDARWNKGDTIAAETVKKQSTALKLRLDEAKQVKDLLGLVRLCVDAARREISHDTVSATQHEKPGGNAVACAATLCIAAVGLEKRQMVAIKTSALKLNKDDESVVLDWLRNAKYYDPQSSACKEVIGARWHEVSPALL